MENTEFIVREFHIIVKNPSDGDPLSCGWKGNVEIDHEQVSIGWKFLLDSGNWFGDYMLAAKEDSNVETVAQAVQVILDQAMRTLKTLRGEDKSGKD